MPPIYQPRRPRASPLWQLVHYGWNDFLAQYESKYRPTLGPLHPAATATVVSFLRCGDHASGFTCLPAGRPACNAPTAATKNSSPSPAKAATSAHPVTILRFRAGSFEWQARGK